MGKDKASINPAQAQRKLEKQKALKKGKAEVAARRNERLAHRNPDRLVRQIEELKSLETSGQPLKHRDRKVLEGLEKDVQAVRKAREALGDRAPQFNRGEKTDRGEEARGRGNGKLGKRKREGTLKSSGSDTDEDVRMIPMPRDTPPPLPPLLSRHGHEKNANFTPLGVNKDASRFHPLTDEPRSVVETPTQTVYEAAPAVRDLRREAINAFVPNAVRMKIQQRQGQGRLLEPAELDDLEREGYRTAKMELSEGNDSPTADSPFPGVTNGVDNGMGPLDEENELLDREVRGVEIEELEDNGS
ncbi:MAG: hypothetical protein M1812_002476 [Candelaria pacifica]|nr:MAG: hypothetical protein M1812_002476 [Candelaria pacifica]